MTPIPGFPDYGMCREGNVWRITPTKHDARLGPVPRRLSVTIVAGNPAVQMMLPGGGSVKKTMTSIRRLVRASL